MIIIAAAAIGIALFYQYGMQDEPCVLCIHIRIWVIAFIPLAAFAIVIKQQRPLLNIAHTLSVLLSCGLLAKCWELFGVERGTIESSCMINAGLPQWFALESWFPTLFEVRGLCGQSPELFFGITMAEGLLAGAILALILTVTMSVYALINYND